MASIRVTESADELIEKIRWWEMRITDSREEAKLFSRNRGVFIGRLMQLVGPAKAAAMLGVTTQTVYRQAAKGSTIWKWPAGSITTGARLTAAPSASESWPSWKGRTCASSPAEPSPKRSANTVTPSSPSVGP